MIPAALLATLAATAPLPPDSVSCRTARETGDVVAGDRACFQLAPDRSYAGIYLDAFEGQSFIEGARSLQDIGKARRDRWIDLRGADLQRIVRYPAGYVRPKTYRPRAYRIRFIGTEPADGLCTFGGPSPRLCYGHMGMWPRLVVADRLIAADYIGDVPMPQLR